ncbi:MAG: sugar phosphate isomerase/epimerase [Bacteroidetes bacterium]|nr:sugar phosphate isomerase/epimerase [Bacteroidota bacterium]
MNRRTFLQSTVALPVAVGALNSHASPQSVKHQKIHTLDRIGVQLYTVRNLLSEDYEGTIGAVADAGYDEVEVVWDPERNPEDIRALFDEVGLVAPSTHASIDALKNNLEAIIDAAKIIGHSFLVCPWLSPQQRTMEHYKSHVILFNEVGAACKEVGIQFAYHNHEFEFEADEGEVKPYDYILEETDPDLVQMEIDLYWIYFANQNPIEYFERYPERFPLCHVKDMGEEREITPVGEGSIDFASIFSESLTAGLNHYFVEHDNPTDALASIRTSINYLRTLEF